MAKFDYFLLMILLSLKVLGIYAANFTRHELLKYLTNTSIYDPNYPPGYDEGVRNDVTVQLEVIDLMSISEQNMEYRVTMIVRMKWKDERLDFRELANFSRLELTGERVKLVWRPDLFISNERKADPHTFLKYEEMAYINPTGVVLFSIRISMTNFCHMKLRHYPFDVQHCEIGIKSYAFTTEMMVLKWSEEAVQFQSLELPNYDISVGNYSSGNLSNKNGTLIDGTFSYLSVFLEFKRKSSAYGSMYFAPYPLFFIIAMSSFAFEDQIGSRITLCTTGMTTSVLQWIAIYARLPPVWYLTYLDGWILVHVIFIGLILVYHAFWYMCLHQAHKQQDEFENLLKETIKMILGEPKKTTKKKNLCNIAMEILQICLQNFKTCKKSKEYEKLLKDEFNDFLNKLSGEQKKNLTSDKRYRIISSEEREKYFRGYVNRLGRNKFLKAIRKNPLDFFVFWIIISIYSIILLSMFVSWTEISKIYLVLEIISISIIVVGLLPVYCRTTAVNAIAGIEKDGCDEKPKPTYSNSNQTPRKQDSCTKYKSFQHTDVSRNLNPESCSIQSDEEASV